MLKIVKQTGNVAIVDAIKPPPDTLQQVLTNRLLAPVVQREEFHEGPVFLTAPDGQFNEYLPLWIGWQESPDPIRASDFWAAGRKVNPQARMPISSQLAIGAKEAVMIDEMRIGKLHGRLAVQQYAGGQLPLVHRTNITEPQPITYGSQYTISGTPSPGNVMLATGMTYDMSETGA